VGERIARHSKANAGGVKTARPAHRVLAKSRFVHVDSINNLLPLLFGDSAAYYGSGLR
jgi:hypothetical protein